jgi:hypothetical protein
LWVRPGTYPRLGHQKGALFGQTPALPTNIGLGWKGLRGTNTIAYYEKLKITGIKSLLSPTNVIKQYNNLTKVYKTSKKIVH